MRKHYGLDPRWELWLRALKDGAEGLLTVVNLTAEERDPSNWRRFGRWPSLSEMKRTCTDQRRQALLVLLGDIFYSDLSEDSHVTFSGLARRSALFDMGPSPVPDVPPAHVRLQVLLTALTVWLALLSQLAGELGLAHEKQRLRGVWKELLARPDVVEAQLIFDQHFDAWLT